mmetsp:Transcript_15113/g.41254  ORF Transcript_15113/g.41254 Transcript_15113/m.41254 type:complete len:321 (+) Transcript_15113:49-1011(+)
MQFRYSTLILATIAACVLAEDSIPCYDGPFDNVLLDGCVDECKSFETLAEAEEHCSSLEMCGGITKSAYGDQEAINLGVGLYEVRQGPGIEAAKGDVSWIKQVNCEESDTVAQQTNALNDINHLVAQHQLTPEHETGEEGEEGDMCYSYSAPVQGQYLEGCVDECRSFQTLQEAQDHCDQIEDCGGVSHSLYGEGQAWHDGVGPYEVRLGPALKPSQDGDISWVRIEHPCGEEGMETGYENEGWDDDLEASVEQADRSLAHSVVMLVAVVALAGVLVYVSYRMGHQITIDYVDRARDKLREVFDKRGAGRETGGGGYEAL